MGMNSIPAILWVSFVVMHVNHLAAVSMLVNSFVGAVFSVGGAVALGPKRMKTLTLDNYKFAAEINIED